MGKQVIWLAAVLLCHAAGAQEKLSHGRFNDVTLHRPQGDAKQFVLFLSGDAGWNTEVSDIARQLVARGAMVAGIDTPQLLRALEADDASCVFPDGDLENLSHYIQGYARLRTYHTPLLVGYSSGATLAYAMIAQAPAGTFMGALSLGFCAELQLTKPLCRGEGVHYKACPAPIPRAQFLDVYDRIVAKADSALPPPPASLANLPLIEVRAQQPGPVFAVVLSGDGGWAGLDKNVAAALANKGTDVVGLDSLRYFWSKRTPDGLAGDLDRIVRYYAAHWKKSAVILVGYSQGADVLPFALNRLPPDSRELVTHAVLMGLSQEASFEFHVGNWMGGDDPDALPIQPEAARLDPRKTLCIYGADETDSLCPQLAPASVEAIKMPGGHHFDGAYEELAAMILKQR